MKVFLLLILSALFSFGIWWLIFWFMSSEINPYNWHWAVKIIYLLISLTATGSVLEEIEAF